MVFDLFTHLLSQKILPFNILIGKFNLSLKSHTPQEAVLNVLKKANAMLVQWHRPITIEAAWGQSPTLATRVHFRANEAPKRKKKTTSKP